MEFDGLLNEPYVPVAIAKFWTGEDGGFISAGLFEDCIPRSNMCGIPKFYEVREKLLHLIQLRALPYPALMDDIRDVAVVTTALFMVNKNLYADIPSFPTFPLYLHCSFHTVQDLRTLLFHTFYNNDLWWHMKEIHAHSPDCARRLGYVFRPQQQAVFYEPPVGPTHNVKTSFIWRNF